MFSLTRKTDYALLAMTRLADEGGLLSAREIAAQFGLSQALLMNVLKQLSGAGILNSVRGARGGYVLSRSAEEITIAELVEAIEGPLRLAPCVESSTYPKKHHTCDVAHRCPIQSQLSWLHGKLWNVFEGTTLAELADAGHAMTARKDAGK